MQLGSSTSLFHWQKNLLHAFTTHDVILLHGNVADLFLYRNPPYHHECSLPELLVRLLGPRYGPLFLFDRYEKACELALQEGGTVTTTRDPSYGEPGFTEALQPAVVRILKTLRGESGPRWCLCRQMHNVLPYKSSYSPDEQMTAIAFQHLAETLRPGKKLVLEYHTDAQIPHGLSSGSPRATLVRIPFPGEEERTTFFQTIVPESIDSRALAQLTDGLALAAHRSLVQQVSDRGATAIRELTLADWQREIRTFKFGESTDPYKQIPFDRLNRAPQFFVADEGVKGQDQAIEKVVEMLWKARTNVSGLLREGNNPPRGVMFFCGPSGVGKTMLATKLAKFLFGSEQIHRFDMSEFQQDHTVSKLIGSPPGYIGYEEGGRLTNALAQKPFSVVLFDEIEKANPRVFDLFLQILSDGRLTDSRGKTVYFSESVVIFTSNIGTRARERDGLLDAMQSGDPAQVRQFFLSAVRDYFKYEISRPELLNRFGNNIVPFNFINTADAQRLTVGFYLDKLTARFNDEYRTFGYTLLVARDEVVEHLVATQRDALSEFGGRAIMNALESVLLPKLAKRLLALEQAPRRSPQSVQVTVRRTDRGEELLVR